MADTSVPEAPHPPRRDLTELAATVPQATFLFAIGHASGGRVHLTGRDGDGDDVTVTATVVTDPPQLVRLSVPSARCSCAGGGPGGLCEHAVAVALADIAESTGTPLADLTAQWFTHQPPAAAAAWSDVEDDEDQDAWDEAEDWDDEDDWDDDEDEDWDDEDEDWEEEDGDGAESVGLSGRGEVDQAAVTAFLGRLGEAQLRSLLLALAEDLPAVAGVLVELAHLPTAPRGG